MRLLNVCQSWGKVLTGKIPMLSIEITRECPLSCPGCYAYGNSHLGEGGPNLRSVSDYRFDDLVKRILSLVDEHDPLQVSPTRAPSHPRSLAIGRTVSRSVRKQEMPRWNEDPGNLVQIEH